MQRTRLWISGVLVGVPAAVMLTGCATAPLQKGLSLDRPPRIGVVGFRVTAPIRHLSSIASAPKGLSREEEASRLQAALRGVEDEAAETLITALNEKGKIEPVMVPRGLVEIRPERRLSATQAEVLRRDLNLDAVLYGEIPRYGRTRATSSAPWRRVSTTFWKNTRGGIQEQRLTHQHLTQRSLTSLTTGPRFLTLHGPSGRGRHCLLSR